MVNVVEIFVVSMDRNGINEKGPVQSLAPALLVSPVIVD
jgi:hypothetical protein